ncbi:serine hydrolase domain-containing protein [Rickettsia endosymbiont of Halotydeus destructor]|uniref:serine hydrolase domain-containing protein n=1 Tax=Rickettsia endosymbiont of Halotydeus destructor TaxID=2996754 RepID=UPI003BB16F46
MIRKYFLLFTFLLISDVNSFANMQERITNVEKNYLENRFLNAVFKFEDEEKPLIIGARGVFSLSGDQLKANEVMPVSSGIKPITAAGILRLQDKGLLNVNDRISKYLDADLWQGTVPDWVDKISIHNLLTHTSGLAEYFGLVKLDFNMSQKEVNEKIIQYITAKPLEVSIGKKYKYSNTNFILLGMIIEKISGQNLADFFRDEFFNPLHMKSTKLASFYEAIGIQKNNVSANYPLRYFIKPTSGKPIFSLANVDFVARPYGDVGIVSCTSDLIKWYKALNQGKILSKKSYKLMTTKYFLAEDDNRHTTYTGYGIFITELDKKHVMIHHSGSALAIRSEAGYIIPDNFYFAILSNVMVKIPEEEKGKINMDNPANQLDIVYFRDAIINAAIAEEDK